MSDELKQRPCPNPWCLNEYPDIEDYTYLDSTEDEVEVFYGRCSKCKIQSPSSIDIVEAIAAWNTRPIEDELRAKVKELDEKLTQQLLVNTILLERNEKLEQWQERAVEAMKACREKDDGAYLYDTEMADLIEQAEGE